MRMKKSFLSRILFASAMAVILWVFSAQSAFAAFPTNWTYRKSHVINASAGAGTGYQVRITVNYGAGPDAGGNVYLNNHSRTDFGDVRFVSSDGVTELPYWMETGSLAPSASAIFWVKVADDLSTVNQTIYVYYGNAAETTTSSGVATFSFFDDFDGTLAKWVKEKEIAPGAITLNAASSYVRCGGGSTTSPYGHTSLGSSPAYSGFTDGAVEVRLKESANALAEIAYRGNFGANTGYKGRYDCRTGNESPHMRPPYYTWAAFGAAVPRFGIGTDTWYRGSVTVTSSGGSYTHRMFRNDVLMSTTTDTTYAGPGEIALQNHYGSYSDYDWVAVRNFVYPEPVHDGWGAEDPLAAAFTPTKSVHIQIDADTSQTITPNDTLRYNVKIQNTGNVTAIGATFADLVPTVDTTYVVGSVAATSGSASYNGGTGKVEWTGNADVGVLIVITFDVTVKPATPVLTVVSNSGTLNYDSDNDGVNDMPLQTDGKPVLPGIQTTDFTVGAPAHGLGTKIAADLNLDGDGILEPGDTVRYTITITNTSGFVPWVPLVFHDTMPANTSYVPGSATVTDVVLDPSHPHPPYYSSVPPVVYTEHVPDILFTDPVLSITDIDITAAAPGNVVIITFDVLLDKSFPDGVTTISNQADVIFDSDGDGINDTLQSTDGDNATPGIQPTVSTVTVGTISGTVFDDLDGDGAQDAGELRMPGVDVNVYDAFINLLYSTDLNGDYIFNGLPSGTYTVDESVPAYYTATTTDPVVGLALAAGGSADVDFGNQVNGHADLMVVKNCTTVAPDGTNQLVFVITVTNEGPDDATNVVLTDDLDALALAGLSSITYTVDNVLPASSWPATNSLPPWGPMTMGASHTVRIYATVAEDFAPEENTATVVSGIFDPTTGDNTSSCTNQLCPNARMAMLFNPAANANVTVASAPSLQLTTTGTIETWIYVDEFQANSELIGKGTVAETYDIGLCGGASGEEFEGGTAQNIGFALYETDGTQHLLIADTQTLATSQWYHIACTWTGTAPGGNINMTIYINGIEKKSQSFAFTNAVRGNTENLAIGFNHPAGGRFIGTMDEVRIWNVAMPLEAVGADNDIRDFMCKKLTGTEIGLVGNWRFDEQCGVVCNDVSAYGNIGITNAERICSAAPIGDISIHDYTNPDFTVALDYLAGDESLTVSAEVPEAWSEALNSGLQVYRVNAGDGQPGPLVTRLFRDRGYWGVFVTGGNGPTYKIEYNYDASNDDGIPGVGNEADLRLNWRHSNCEIWKTLDATPGTNTLTKGGFSGTEFILGTDLPPRNAILFDGVNDVVTVTPEGGDTSLDLTTLGTLEAWVYVTSSKNASIINKGDATNGYVLAITAAGNITLNVYNSVPPSASRISTAVLLPNIWYHVAATWDNAAQPNIYINGVLSNGAGTGPGSSGSTTGSPLTIGGNGATGFQGRIDEVRAWNVARSQTAVRDTLCKKVTSSDSGFANLVGNWRFDEETDSCFCQDETTNDNDGAMSGFGTCDTDDIRAPRVCSSAPIGDDSAYGYYDSGALSPVTVQLAHSDGDYMEVTENTTIGGPWTNVFSGLHIYRLDEAPVYPPDRWEDTYYDYQSPNGLTPPDTATPPPDYWSSIDYYRYWGVFVTDWDAANTPRYDVVYHYAGNPLTPDDDSVVGLARRPEYCFGTWTDTDVDPDTGADTLTLNDDFQYGAPPTNPEYIFGGKDAPLAITLASFTATADNGCVEVAWETATEINTAGFHVWRSDNPFTGFARVTDGMIASTSEMETMGAGYSFQDCGVDFSTGAKYYYMLEEIEIDTTGSGNMHGPIGPVTETIAAAQGGSGSNDKACFIDSLR